MSELTETYAKWLDDWWRDIPTVDLYPQGEIHALRQLQLSQGSVSISITWVVCSSSNYVSVAWLNRYLREGKHRWISNLEIR